MRKKILIIAITNVSFGSSSPSSTQMTWNQGILTVLTKCYTPQYKSKAHCTRPPCRACSIQMTQNLSSFTVLTKYWAPKQVDRQCDNSPRTSKQNKTKANKDTHIPRVQSGPSGTKLSPNNVKPCRLCWCRCQPQGPKKEWDICTSLPNLQA